MAPHILRPVTRQRWVLNLTPRLLYRTDKSPGAWSGTGWNQEPGWTLKTIESFLIFTRIRTTIPRLPAPSLVSLCSLRYSWSFISCWPSKPLQNILSVKSIYTFCPSHFTVFCCPNILGGVQIYSSASILQRGR